MSFTVPSVTLSPPTKLIPYARTAWIAVGAHAARRVPSTRSVIIVAILLNVVVSALLAPIAANPFDIALLAGTASSWLGWGTPLFLYWKFGFDYTLLNVLAGGAAHLLVDAGFSVPAAQHIGFKLPLIVANIACALLLRELALRIAPSRANSAVLLWLLSPVGIWVAAGHGQIEPVALALLLWSLLLLLRRRMFFGGLVAGLGVGFEYFPLAFACAVGALWISGRLTRRQAGWAFFGLVIGLTFCFGPSLSTQFGRANLYGGLVAHAIATPGQIDEKPGSLWWLIDARWLSQSIVSHWYLFLGIGAAVMTAVASVRCRKLANDRAVLGALGSLLALAVILDPTVLPQFAYIAQAALILIWLDQGLPAWMISSISFLAVAGYFVSDHWYTYFEDVTPRIFTIVGLGRALPEPPISPGVYGFALDCFAAGLLFAILTWTSQNTHRLKKIGILVATSFEAIVVVVIAIWASQPALWVGVAGKEPSHLFDYPYLTSYRRGQTTIVGNSFITTMDPLLSEAAKQSRIPPLATVAVQSGGLVDNREVGSSLNANRPTDLTIPANAMRIRNIQNLWVSLLAHNDSWRSVEQVDGHALLAGNYTDASSRSLLIPGWSVLTYSVPVTWFTKQDALTSYSLSVELTASGSLFNASITGQPWLLVLPQKGKVLIRSANNSEWWAPFDLGSDGSGVVWLGNISILNQEVSLDGNAIGGLSILSAGYSWPDADTALHAPLPPAIAVASLLFLVAMVTSLGLLSVLLSKQPATDHSLISDIRPRPAQATRPSPALSASPLAMMGAARRAVRNWISVVVPAWIVVPSRCPPKRGISRLANRQVLVQLRSGLQLECRLNEVFNVLEVFAFGAYDLPSVDRYSVRTVIDIGANIGAATLWFSQKFPLAHVLAVEPGSQTASRLKANIHRNGLSNRVEVITAAVGAQEGAGSLIPGYSSALSHLDPSGRTGEVVSVITLEGLFARVQDGEIDLVKLDCEGSEYEIILGVTPGVIARVRNLVAEYHGVEGHSPVELAYKLQRDGFRTQVLETGTRAGRSEGLLSAVREREADSVTQ